MYVIVNYMCVNRVQSIKETILEIRFWL